MEHNRSLRVMMKALVIFITLIIAGAASRAALAPFAPLSSHLGGKMGAERKDSVNVWGKVRDYFTNEKIESGIVTVYNEQDSIVLIDSIHGPRQKHWGTWAYTEDPGYGFKLPRGGNYKIRFDVEGYVSEPQDLIIPDRQFHKYTTDWMKDYKIRRKAKEQVLNGVTVKATRIKMVVKGDTIEYDADAFQLAEGSMLDKLIEAMPGMELKDNGEIYSNGKKIETLLVNGKDFFSGDPKTALENLPAYTVKKVQVYRKDDDASYLIKDSLQREDMKKLVVNVKLKKEYSKGWIFNSDMAYGTQDRYIGRAAAIFFTDAVKFLGYANFNNLNLRGGIGDDGGWWGRSAPQGLHRVKTGGFRVMCSQEDKYNINTGLNISHANDLDESVSSSETYLTTGDTYNRSRSQNRNTSTSANWWDWMDFHFKHMWLGISPLEGSFSRSRGSANSVSATFDGNPLDAYRGASLDSLFLPLGSTRLEQMRLNTVLNATQSVNTSANLGSHGHTWFRSPIFGNSMNVNYNFSYERNRNKNFQHYTLDNRQTSSVQKQNVYTLSPSHSLSFNTDFSYDLVLGKKVGLNIGYAYGYNQNKNRPERYRLDSLAGWNNFDEHPLGELPSLRDSMLLAMDVENSYHRSLTSQNHRPKIEGHIGIFKHWVFVVDLPLKMQHESISDTRPAPGQRKTGSLTALEPTFRLNRHTNDDGVVSSINLSYNTSRSLPSLHYKLDLTDNTNPLFISKGNADLRNTVYHNIDANFHYGNALHVQNYGANFHWGRINDNVASATTYDRSTGVTTYQPRNINGNWNMNAGINFERSVDKNDRFMLRNNINGNYNHSVDYISDFQGQAVEPFRSVVHNYNLNEEFRFTYRHKERMVSLRANANFRWQNSSRANFNSVRAVDFSYGIRSHGPIAWGFYYETDLRVYSRRGYNDASMNDNNIIWGLNLSRSFLKGKQLTLRLEAHDLLGQLNNVRTNINSQGRSETWYNSIPRYALLHVAYKFNTMSKKKQEESQE